MRHFTYLFALLILPLFGFSQVVTCVTIANETANTAAGTYTFDVYLQTGTGTSGDLYLATSDVQIRFNAANFSVASLAKVDNPSPPLGIQNGYCTLIPTNTDNGGITDILAQFTYHGAIQTSVTGDLASINLNTISVSSSNILTTIAKIDGTSNTHRLGRFTLSGYTGGSPGLTLVTTGALRTRIFTYATTSPYAATATTLTTCGGLPLDWISFTGEMIADGSVQLDWITAHELNNHHFEVERKSPQGQYAPIGKTEAKGNGLPSARYSFSDTRPLPGKARYRIRQVDVDGQYSFSQEIEIIHTGAGTVMVYPNPARDQLTVKLPSHTRGTARLKLIGMDGRTVLETHWEAEGAQAHQLSLRQLPEGSYAYLIQTTESRFSGTLLKYN